MDDEKQLIDKILKDFKGYEVQKIFWDHSTNKILVIAPLDNMDGMFVYVKNIKKPIPFVPIENTKLYEQLTQEDNLIYDKNELDLMIHSSTNSKSRMNKYTFYDNLNKYKKNAIRHAADYGTGYYQKIDKYYPDGRTRYFYSKGEWEAYQEGLKRTKWEQEQKNKKAAEEAKKSTGAKAGANIEANERTKYENYKKELNELVRRNKIDDAKELMKAQPWVNNFKEDLKKEILNGTEYPAAFTKVYDKYHKDIFENSKVGIKIISDIEDELIEFRENVDKYKGSSKNTKKSPTNLADAKAASDRVRIEETRQDIKNAETYDEKVEILLNSPEGKELQEKYKKIFNENYLNDKSIAEIGDDIRNSNEYKKLEEIDDKLIRDVMYRVARKALKDYIRDENRKNNISNREQAEDEVIKATRLASDDPEVVQLGVNMELNEYNSAIADSNYSKGYITSDEKDDILNNYAEYVTSMSLLREKEEKDPNNGLPLLSTEMSIEETMKYINPGRGSQIDDIYGGGNCALCTLAMDLRMRGYDVSAPNVKYSTDVEKGYNNAEKYQGYEYESFWDWLTMNKTKVIEPTENTNLSKMYTTKPKMISDNDANKLKEKVSEQTNTYGYFGVQWNKGGGHAMFYTVDGSGNITIYDGQVNGKHDLDEIMSTSHDWEFVRTDNLEINYDYIKKANWIVYS